MSTLDIFIMILLYLLGFFSGVSVMYTVGLYVVRNNLTKGLKNIAGLNPMAGMPDLKGKQNPGVDQLRSMMFDLKNRRKGMK